MFRSISKPFLYPRGDQVSLVVAGKAYQQSCTINIQSRKGGEKQVEGVHSQ
jgi:hypothetical protein